MFCVMTMRASRSDGLRVLVFRLVEGKQKVNNKDVKNTLHRTLNMKLTVKVGQLGKRMIRSGTTTLTRSQKVLGSNPNNGRLSVDIPY